MPAAEGIGRDQGVPVTAYPSPEARGLCGPAPALGVGEPETARTELLSADAMRTHGISRATFFKWRSKYGGASVSDMTRLWELEAEHAKLKRMYADLALDGGTRSSTMTSTIINFE